ncbi:hypothetical protein GCM10026982_13730 [Nocardiopsis aegyptia]
MTADTRRDSEKGASGDSFADAWMDTPDLPGMVRGRPRGHGGRVAFTRRYPSGADPIASGVVDRVTGGVLAGHTGSDGPAQRVFEAPVAEVSDRGPARDIGYLLWGWCVICSTLDGFSPEGSTAPDGGYLRTDNGQW